ncbi:hypothetical protein LOAG_03870 [Loa loa]|uniref:Uncharacterized protein n=1 Tax=Loa loa TaxID=7209 RepID=A0A1S0U558_LOALO|nr:hypothetical protein LOAG_03870 [Loa loa]EFO24613.1 hypothetical protein LOAG_03870 [Loa loa]
MARCLINLQLIADVEIGCEGDITEGIVSSEPLIFEYRGHRVRDYGLRSQAEGTQTEMEEGMGKIECSYYRITFISMSKVIHLCDTCLELNSSTSINLTPTVVVQQASNRIHDNVATTYISSYSRVCLCVCESTMKLLNTKFAETFLSVRFTFPQLSALIRKESVKNPLR